MADGDFYHRIKRIPGVSPNNEVERTDSFIYVKCNPDDQCLQDLHTFWLENNGGRFGGAPGIGATANKGFHTPSSDAGIEELEHIPSTIRSTYAQLGEMFAQYNIDQIVPHLILARKIIQDGEFSGMDQWLAELINLLMDGWWQSTGTLAEVDEMSTFVFEESAKVHDHANAVKAKAQETLQKAEEKEELAEQVIRSTQAEKEAHWRQWIKATKETAENHELAMIAMSTFHDLRNSVRTKIVEIQNRLSESTYASEIAELKTAREILGQFMETEGIVSPSVAMSILENSEKAIEKLNEARTSSQAEFIASVKEAKAEIESSKSEFDQIIDDLYKSLELFATFHDAHLRTANEMDEPAFLPYEEGSGYSSELTEGHYELALKIRTEKEFQPSMLALQVDQIILAIEKLFENEQCFDQTTDTLITQVTGLISEARPIILADLASEEIADETPASPVEEISKQDEEVRNDAEVAEQTESEVTEVTEDQEPSDNEAFTDDTDEVEPTQPEQPIEMSETIEVPEQEVPPLPDLPDHLTFAYQFMLIAGMQITRSTERPQSGQSFHRLMDRTNQLLQTVGLERITEEEESLVQSYLNHPKHRICVDPKTQGYDFLGETIRTTELDWVYYDLNIRRPCCYKLSNFAVERVQALEADLIPSTEEVTDEAEAAQEAQHEVETEAEPTSSVPEDLAPTVLDPQGEAEEVSEQLEEPTVTSDQPEFPFRLPRNLSANGLISEDRLVEVHNLLKAIGFAIRRSEEHESLVEPRFVSPAIMIDIAIDYGYLPEQLSETSFRLLCAIVLRQSRPIDDQERKHQPHWWYTPSSESNAGDTKIALAFEQEHQAEELMYQYGFMPYEILNSVLAYEQD